MSRSPDRRSDRRPEGRPERGSRPRPGASRGPARGGPRPGRFRREEDGSSPRDSGDRSTSDRPAGDRFGGDRLRGDRFGGGRPDGERPAGGRFGADRGAGDRFPGTRPGGDRPFADRNGGPRRLDRPGERRAFGRGGYGRDRPGGSPSRVVPGPAGAGAAGSDRPRPGRFGTGRPGLDRSGPDRPGLDRPESRSGEFRSFERRPSDRFSRDRNAGDRRPSSRPPAGSRFRDGDRSQRPSFPRPSFPRPPAGVESRPPRTAGEAGSLPAPEGDHFAAAAPAELIWGRHACQASLESGRPIHRIWCTAEMRFSPRFLQLLREAKGSGVLVEEVTWARLGQISGGAVHQGIVLQPAAAETLDLPTLVDGCRGLGEAPLLMAVDGLTDPQNLGAIVRSAEALGAHGLVLPQRRNAGLTGSVAKVAAGALEHLPVARVVNLNRALDSLKQEGYRVIGLAGEGNLSLEEADLDGPLVVVTGSEGEGLSMLTRRTCDQLVRIPLRGATPSLNASVATALLLYEVARRGWMKGLRGNAPAPRLVRPSLPSTPVRATQDSLPMDELPAVAEVQAEASAFEVDDKVDEAVDDEVDEEVPEPLAELEDSDPAPMANGATPSPSDLALEGLEPREADVPASTFEADIRL